MIKLCEQYGYKDIHQYVLTDLSHLDDFAETGEKRFSKKKDDGLCFRFWKEKDNSQYHFQTSYYVGVDWLLEGKEAIYIEPKQNDEALQINYLKMLVEALEEESNSKHLDELFIIDFNKPFIEIEQSQDLLTPLLIYQYLSLLKKIVRKVLKKSYYKVERNLNARVKGKVLVNQTIKHNLVKSKNTSTFCSFDEFGVNSLENRALKKAFEFSKAILGELSFDGDQHANSLCSYINPAFQSIDSDVNILELKHIKPNALFPEYEQALKLAKIILRKYGYSISRTTEKQVETPPFWIDMSKLFELYVYSKLKQEFPLPDEVIYHPTVNRLELDYLVKSKDGQFKMVVDAKYKPRYENNNVLIDDIRQVSGYARLNKVYDILQEDDKSKVIECLIIFSSQNTSNDLKKEILRSVPESNYVDFYKIGIKLPELSK